MATYYVDFDNGLDANNGLGPDASHGSNKPWKTPGKVWASGTTVVAGDTVYFAPGIYYLGAGVTFVSSVFTPGTPTNMIGDPTNTQGFKNSGGVRKPAGVVWITTRTAAEGMDGPTASTANLLNLDGTNKGGLQFYNMAFEAASNSTSASVVALGLGTNQQNILFQDCLFVGCMGITLTPGTAALDSRNITFQGCEFWVTHAAFNAVITAAPATADVDIGLTFQGCLIHGRASPALSLAPSGGNLAGGVRWKYCTIDMHAINTTAYLTTTAVRISTMAPLIVEGCVILGSAGVNAGTAGHVISGGNNLIHNASTDTNYSAANTDIYGFMPRLKYPSLVKWGLLLPSADLGYGFESGATPRHRFSAGSNTGADFFNRTARPWGSGPTIGAMEYGDVAQDIGSQITAGGASSLRISGAGELAFYAPLDAVATTITVVTKSVSYGGSSYPQLIIEPNPLLGLARQTATATDATEQTLTIGPFTPTDAGVVEIRLISRSTSVSGATYFDVLQAA